MHIWPRPRMRGLLIALILLFSVMNPAQAAPTFQLVDLSREFVRFYDETGSMPVEARVAAYKARFRSLFPGFYTAERLASDGIPEARYDELIRNGLQRFPNYRARFERISRGFRRMIEPALAHFVRVFPDLRPIGNIYLIHSMGEMDGGTRMVEGRQRLIFGADVMAQVHNFDDERPFFEHELFHVYHGQFFAGCEHMWCDLWQEGMATYVAKSLNPDAGDDQLLWTYPQPLRPFVEAHPAQAVCAIRAGLDGNSGAFFSGGHAATGLPPRVGYYVGYLVVQRLARDHSLQQLAHLNVTQARPLVEAALNELASCPG
jgi:hypothetical protein